MSKDEALSRLKTYQDKRAQLVSALQTLDGAAQECAVWIALQWPEDQTVVNGGKLCDTTDDGEN